MTTASARAAALDTLAAVWQIGDLPTGPGGLTRMKALAGIEVVADLADPRSEHAIVVELGPDGALSPRTVEGLESLYGPSAVAELREGGSFEDGEAVRLLAEYAAADALVHVRDPWVPRWFTQLRWALLRARLDAHLVDQLGPGAIAIKWLERSMARDVSVPAGQAVVGEARALVAALRGDRPDLAALADRLDAWLDSLPSTESNAPQRERAVGEDVANDAAQAVRHGAVAALRASAGEREAAAWSWEQCARSWRRVGNAEMAEAALAYATALRGRATAADEPEADRAGGRVITLRPRAELAMAAEASERLDQPSDDPILFDVFVEDAADAVASVRVWRLPGLIQVEHAGGVPLRLGEGGAPLKRARLRTRRAGAGDEPVVDSLHALERLVDLYE